jgi:hypothetical protein
VVQPCFELGVKQAELILDGEDPGSHCSQISKMVTKLPSPSEEFLPRFLLKYSIMNAQLQRMCKAAKLVHIAICEGVFLSFYVWYVVSNNHVEAVIGNLPFF